MLEKKLEASVSEITSKSKKEQQEAHESIRKMERKMDLVVTEVRFVTAQSFVGNDVLSILCLQCDALKAAHKFLKDELQANERWQIKYEKVTMIGVGIIEQLGCKASRLVASSRRG